MNGNAAPHDTVDPVAALCERVRDLARQSGGEALRNQQEEAVRLVAEARQRAEAECQVELAQARKRIARQVERQMQSARLEARASLARIRWSLLGDVLDEAVHRIAALRETDAERYAAALDRFLRGAQRQLPVLRLMVKGSARDLDLLRRKLDQTAAPEQREQALDFVEADLAAGIQVGTPEWGQVADHSLSRRRERLEQELRLAAAEALFEDGPGARS